MQTVSDSELLPQLQQLAGQYRAGKFSVEEMAQAIEELGLVDELTEDTLNRLVRALDAADVGKPKSAQAWPSKLPQHTFARYRSTWMHGMQPTGHDDQA